MKFILSLCFAFVYMVDLGIAAPAICETDCRFELCQPSVVSLGPPNDEAQTSAICLNGRPVGIVNSGEALVRTYADIPISLFQPPILKQPYSPSFFKTYNVADGSSGIGHETPQQNQADVLDDFCILLPVHEYQVIKKVGKHTVVLKNVQLAREDPLKGNCVSFVTSSA